PPRCLPRAGSRTNRTPGNPSPRPEGHLSRCWTETRPQEFPDPLLARPPRRQAPTKHRLSDRCEGSPGEGVDGVAAIEVADLMCCLRGEEVPGPLLGGA